MAAAAHAREPAASSQQPAPTVWIRLVRQHPHQRAGQGAACPARLHGQVADLPEQLVPGRAGLRPKLLQPGSRTVLLQRLLSRPRTYSCHKQLLIPQIPPHPPTHPPTWRQSGLPSRRAASMWLCTHSTLHRTRAASPPLLSHWSPYMWMHAKSMPGTCSRPQVQAQAPVLGCRCTAQGHQQGAMPEAEQRCAPILLPPPQMRQTAGRSPCTAPSRCPPAPVLTRPPPGSCASSPGRASGCRG